MGRLAGEFSDLTVVTTDNPRSEDPNKIIENIEQGLKEQALPHFDREELREIPGYSGYVVRPDRREAIALAVRLAKPGDVILIAGKGHETYQVLGTETIHFDDREEARMSLEANDVQH
jgi:UDP-N-acetylmuramoyl-L-alanyl-D-glutamate--2,6-diaminopimelate ligase